MGTDLRPIHEQHSTALRDAAAAGIPRPGTDLSTDRRGDVLRLDYRFVTGYSGSLPAGQRVPRPANGAGKTWPRSTTLSGSPWTFSSLRML